LTAPSQKYLFVALRKWKMSFSCKDSENFFHQHCLLFQVEHFCPILDFKNFLHQHYLMEKDFKSKGRNNTSALQPIRIQGSSSHGSVPKSHPDRPCAADRTPRIAQTYQTLAASQRRPYQPTAPHPPTSPI
jgi:hypothetical protein